VAGQVTVHRHHQHLSTWHSLSFDGVEERMAGEKISYGEVEVE